MTGDPHQPWIPDTGISGSGTMSGLGTMTSEASRSPKMMAPVSNRWAKSSMTPSSCRCRLSLRGPPPSGRPPGHQSAEHRKGGALRWRLIEKSDQGSEDEDEPRNGKARSMRFAQGRKS